jgi:hypothetical protein
MEREIVLRLTFDEAFELIDRCVSSQQLDNDALRSALIKLTSAVRETAVAPAA